MATPGILGITTPTSDQKNKRKHAALAFSGRKHMDMPAPGAFLTKDIWHGAPRAVAYGRESFRLAWQSIHGERQYLDPWVESFTWDDAMATVSGQLQLRASGLGYPVPNLQIGDLIICEIQPSPKAVWRELWRLRIDSPSRQATGELSFNLVNDLALLAASTDDFKYKHDKAHPHGWYPWQIVQDVCKRYKISCVCPQIGKRIKKFPIMKAATPGDVIGEALKRAHKDAGTFFLRRFENNTLYISTRHYNPALLELTGQITQAILADSRREGYATALTVRATGDIKNGRDANGKWMYLHRQIVVKLTVPEFIKRYGYVHKIVYAHGAESPAEATAAGLLHLALALRPKRELTITAPGIYGLRRGAYIKVTVPSLGLAHIVYVMEVRWTVSASEFTMELTLGFDDPQLQHPQDTVNENETGEGLAFQPQPKNNNKKDGKTKQPPAPTPAIIGISTPVTPARSAHGHGAGA